MAALPDPSELEPGVTLDSLSTPEQCDAALDRLTVVISAYERRLSAAPRRSPHQPAGWRANVEAELRMKRMLLPRIQQRRAELKRLARQLQHEASPAGARDRANRRRSILLDLAHATEPDAMQRVAALARERHPTLFSDGETA